MCCCPSLLSKVQQLRCAPCLACIEVKGVLVEEQLFAVRIMILKVKKRRDFQRSQNFKLSKTSDSNEVQYAVCGTYVFTIVYM